MNQEFDNQIVKLDNQGNCVANQKSDFLVFSKEQNSPIFKNPISQNLP